mmetsp:Transcript_5228/g.11067  ORF Transcript_5228/g.11067 Transcript_5228/m.11067 type:complete len:94 (+) Transcript_5228:986-1267(+)
MHLCWTQSLHLILICFVGYEIRDITFRKQYSFIKLVSCLEELIWRKISGSCNVTKKVSRIKMSSCTSLALIIAMYRLLSQYLSTCINNTHTLL